METAVALLIFNRPDATARVFEVVRRVRPPILLLVADGPRPDRSGEKDRCAAARAAVDRVDWPCDVRVNYSDANLGCKRRVASGLDWVFENVSESIILEDDCLPDPSFFSYCASLLERYRHDDRIMHIGGNNFGAEGRIFGQYSYGFSRFPQVWGWATWRRAWRHFQLEMPTWPTFRDGGWLRSLPIRGARLRRQAQRWEDAIEGRVDTWDFQWHYAVMSQHGLAAVPRRNLVSNIGFSPDATHTRDMNSVKSNVPCGQLDGQLLHPPFVASNPALDEFMSTQMLGDSTLARALVKARRLLSPRGVAP